MKRLSKRQIDFLGDIVLNQMSFYLDVSGSNDKETNLVAADGLLKLVTLLTEYHGHLKVYAHTMCEQQNSN